MIECTTSATLGTSCTIKETGYYALSYADYGSTTAHFGFSVNSTQLTTNLAAINASDRIMLTNSQANFYSNVSATLYLTNNAVVRPHTDGAPDNTGPGAKFYITKIN